MIRKMNINTIAGKGYHPIIPYNLRNTKNKKLIKKLTSKEKEIYRKRIIVEKYFSWIKTYPKIDKIHEKTKKSYMGLLYLASIKILINRMKQ